MELPLYFILSRSRENPILAYTSNKQPPIITFECEIKVKGYDKIIKVVSTRRISKPHIYTTSMNPKNFSVYKSNLQKCIRRRLTDNAVLTAYNMLSSNAADFLRRLPIIILEDTLPHPSLIPLVWFMMAVSKGYELTDFDVSYVLGIVYAVCTIETYQVYNSTCTIPNPTDPTFTVAGWSTLQRISRDLLWAMEFRKAYGGMACDVKMITYLQYVWFTRFNTPSLTIGHRRPRTELPEVASYKVEASDTEWVHLKNIPINLVDLSSIASMGVIGKEIIIHEAIDQHCYKFIPGKTRAAHPQFTEYEIKGAIWFYRSSLNARTVSVWSVPIKTIPKLRVIYKTIKRDVDNLAQWIHTTII